MNEKNLHFHKNTISTRDKTKRNQHNPCVVWLTGLSGSGKSTIANALESELFKIGCQTHVLDGDNVRMGLNKDLGFSPEDRSENIRRIGEVANLFAQSGTILITAFISPYQKDRDIARRSCSQKFLEVFVDSDLETCEARDPKGLYKKARSGEIKGFTGIDAPYEAPDHLKASAIRVDSRSTTVGECVDQILEKLNSMNVIGVKL